VSPVAAYVDTSGHPSILTEFRQGLPLLESVSRGRLSVDQAAVLLGQLLDVTTAAHARGLVHGSIAGGNVFVGTDGAPYLLDFGLAVIVSPAPSGDWAALDLDGFARMRRAVRQ
jgi:serine/threonine protein kinase